MNNLVSIIVTSYNHAEYLDQRMECLLNQTYDRIEIIVIDDCSSDDSMNVLAKYRQYSHIQIINLKENSGYANACNIGVSLCSGEYIMFAECDDFNEPTHIEALMEKMLQNPIVGVAYCRSNMVDGNGVIYGSDFQYREKSFQALCYKDVLIPQKMIQRFFLISCVVPNMSAAIIKKDYFKMVDGFDPLYKTCADWDFWCRISGQCDFYYTKLALNNFRTHRTTVRNTSGVTVPMTEILRLLYSAHSKTELSSSEYFKFKLNIGLIWANYFFSNPLMWVRDFSVLLKKSNTYNRWSLIYLFAGFIMRLKTSILAKLF